MLSPSVAKIVNNQYISNLQQFKVYFNYNINSLSEYNACDEEVYPISIFGHIEFFGNQFQKHIYFFTMNG